MRLCSPSSWRAIPLWRAITNEGRSHPARATKMLILGSMMGKSPMKSPGDGALISGRCTRLLVVTVTANNTVPPPSQSLSSRVPERTQSCRTMREWIVAGRTVSMRRRSECHSFWRNRFDMIGPRSNSRRSRWLVSDRITLMSPFCHRSRRSKQTHLS